jgi:antitoxin VapB
MGDGDGIYEDVRQEVVVTTTRVFKSGNSQAVRIPAELAYADAQHELQITRVGDVITIFPKRGSLKEDVILLRAMPKAEPMDPSEQIDVPDRDWD